MTKKTYEMKKEDTLRALDSLIEYFHDDEKSRLVMELARQVVAINLETKWDK